MARTEQTNGTAAQAGSIPPPRIAYEPAEMPQQPQATMQVPFHRPVLGQEEEREVLDTLRSGWLTTGPKTKRFESDFAEYVGARHAIALNSCTAALHLALLVHDVGPGDEVITTPMTFASTANVIEHVGARPVFVDVLPGNLNMDPAKLGVAMTPRTRAVIPVHFAGHPCDLDAIREIAGAHGVPVIEDAAHAIESVYRGRKIGGISEATCFSFYATKNITTGEGGMITTNDDALAERLRILSLHGISVDAWQRYRPGGYKHWDILEAGFKYNMCDIQACLGIHQLARIDQLRQARRAWTAMYDEAFEDMPEIITLERSDDVDCAYHLFAVRFVTESLNASRERIMELLQERGVGIGIHFRPVHLHPYYRDKYGYASGTHPVAEYAGNRTISLPLFPDMTAEEVLYVIHQVREVVWSLRKTRVGVGHART